jgi:SEC-C motif
MLSTGLLTSDDLDEIGCSFSDQPFEVAAELVDAVDQGRVADAADTGYALMLAAEITERAGDLPAAQVLVGRAVEAYRRHGGPDSYPRAFHAELLLRLGREDEAMAELTALRPLLSEDPNVVSYLSEALEAGGRAEIAEQWLTAALHTALQRQREWEPQGPEPDYRRIVEVVLALAQCRHRVRRDLDLPHDEHDDLADQLMDVVLDALGDDELNDEPTALLFWPRPEFERLLLRWPALAEHYGQTWDEYRTTLQQTLVLGSESGVPRLGLLTGSVDELATYADRSGGDPTDPQVRQDYAQHLTEHPRAGHPRAGHPWEIDWPPGRNDPCWCGSPLKYKKCCLPRART